MQSSRVLSFLTIPVWIFSSNVYSCVGCGMAESFTPRMLLIGLGFFFLPVLLVSSIIYFVWKDQKTKVTTKEKS